MNFVSVRQRLLKQRRFRRILGACLLLALIAGVLIVPIESYDREPIIASTSDGLWWAVQTLTTVGYGDEVPVTDIGRLLGVIVQLVGALGFGVIVAMISTSMSRNQEEFYWSRLFERLNTIDERLTMLERQSKFLVEEEREELDTLAQGLPHTRPKK